MNFKIMEGESYDDYGYRLYKNKSLYGLNNCEIADLLNNEFGVNKDESAHRKYFSSYIKGFDNGYSNAIGETEEDGFKPSSLTPKGHLYKLVELTGEYSIRKRSMELERLELSKLMRQATPAILLVEKYEEVLLKKDFLVPNFIFNKRNEKGSCVIKSLLSDLHIGLEIDEEYNQYNYEIAIKRMKKYTESILEYAQIFNANTISITLMGDIVEGFDLRNPQKWDCEFTFDEQIVKAQDLIMSHIYAIVKHGYNVDLSACYGNHDRLTGDKKDSVESNNAVFVIMENIKNTFKAIEKFTDKKIESVNFVQYDKDYKYHVDNYYGIKIRYQHGDKDNMNDKNKIEKYNGVDNDFYDGLVFGHYHHYRHTQRNRDTFEIYCGCLQGANDYGKDVVHSVSDSSQTIIIIRDNGKIIPININLQNA